MRIAVERTGAWARLMCTLLAFSAMMLSCLADNTMARSGSDAEMVQFMTSLLQCEVKEPGSEGLMKAVRQRFPAGLERRALIAALGEKISLFACGERDRVSLESSKGRVLLSGERIRDIAGAKSIHRLTISFQFTQQNAVEGSVLIIGWEPWPGGPTFR